MTSLLNFTKIYQLVQKLLGGTHRQTDRQTGDLISLSFLFEESRLKMDLGGGRRGIFVGCYRNIRFKVLRKAT
jgi:hypothetical protein